MPRAPEIDQNGLLAIFRDQFLRWGFDPRDTDEVVLRLADVIDYERGQGKPEQPGAVDAQIARYRDVLLEFFDIRAEAATAYGEALHLWEVLSAEKITPPGKPQPVSQSRTFLVLATEWEPRHGGLSTFNQRLCTSLADNGVKVICYVGRANQTEINEAAEAGVTLLVAPAVPTVPDNFRVMIMSDALASLAPDFIVGHDRQTGAAALALAPRFPGAKVVIFSHTAPRRIEWLKDDRKNPETLGVSANTRFQEQKELFERADFVVAVGPALLKEAELTLLPQTRRKGNKKAHPMVFLPGVVIQDDSDLGAHAHTVLFVGRAEDTRLKGLDIIDGAVKINRDRHNLTLDCTLLGADERTEHKLRQSFSCFTNVIAYDPSRDILHEQLARADVLLMPSREEGFGLVAIEAIECNRPFLVSQQSGFAQYIRVIAGNCSASAKVLIEHLIVNVDVDRPDELLAEKLRWMFGNWEAVVDLMASLRAELHKPEYSWKQVTQNLLQRLDDHSQAPSD